jgi:hypothetical protein
MAEILTALFIHFLVPMAGVCGYALLCRKLRSQGASDAFLAQLFLIFFCWGGWLMLVMTSLFWRWSALASLGAAFLVFIAPVVMGITGVCLAKTPNASAAQRRAKTACFGYFGALAFLIAFAFVASR